MKNDMSNQLIDYMGLPNWSSNLIGKSSTRKGHPRKISVFKKALAITKE